jgi:hypothetical protein
MKLELRPEQWRLIQTAVRRYQIERCLHNSNEYHECGEILDELFDYVYTQNREQST